MTQSAKVLLIALILLAAGTILVLGTTLLAGWFIIPTRNSTISIPQRISRYSTNGEQIYLSGTSESGPPISFRMQRMHRMRAGNMSCAACHGIDGSGGTVRMMMTSVDAPDIRWEHLIEEEHHEDDGETHPAYTEDSFKRAVTEGLDPSGEQLHWMMPRWEMTDQQLNDLISYLQSID